MMMLTSKTSGDDGDDATDDDDDDDDDADNGDIIKIDDKMMTVTNIMMEDDEQHS